MAASKQYPRTPHCSHASVGLAQARPNDVTTSSWDRMIGGTGSTASIK